MRLLIFPSFFLYSFGIDTVAPVSYSNLYEQSWRFVRRSANPVRQNRIPHGCRSAIHRWYSCPLPSDVGTVQSQSASRDSSFSISVSALILIQRDGTSVPRLNGNWRNTTPSGTPPIAFLSDNDRAGFRKNGMRQIPMNLFPGGKYRCYRCYLRLCKWYVRFFLYICRAVNRSWAQTGWGKRYCCPGQDTALQSHAQICRCKPPSERTP